MSVEKITRKSLKGTVLENADLNAVSLLDKDDSESLKNTKQVDELLDETSRIYEETFNTEN